MSTLDDDDDDDDARRPHRGTRFYMRLWRCLRLVMQAFVVAC